MNYENFTEKQKQVIEIFRSWSENLKEDEIRISELKSALRAVRYGYDSKFLILQYKSLTKWNIWTNIASMIQSISDLYKCSNREYQDILSVAKSKNYWLKFEPKVVKVVEEFI